MTEITWKSQADYARHRRLTRAAIGKAIACSRIPPEAVRRDGRSVLIDVAAADLAWPHKLRVETPIDDDLDLPGQNSPAASSSPVPQRETPRLTAARTEQAEIAARIQSLELAKRTGEVLLAVDVAASMTILAESMVRDVDQLHAFTDDIVTAFHRNGAAGVRALLKDVSRRMRNMIAENMRLLEKADAAAFDDELAEEGSPTLALSSSADLAGQVPAQ